MFKCGVCSVAGGGASKDVPSVTGGLHSKIANGSRLIEINCTTSQGRFLKVCLDPDITNQRSFASTGNPLVFGE